MKIVVTGAGGTVAHAVVGALLANGHDVTATDVVRPGFPAAWAGAVPYLQADLCDAGSAMVVVAGADVVVHAAAIPSPDNHPGHVVFHNNVQSTYNVVEAAVRCGVGRVVNISSEAVGGYIYGDRRVVPRYVPVDEEHPTAPQDPYSVGKSFAEQLCTAAALRSDLRCTTLRPTWVQWEATYERNLGPIVRQPMVGSENLWAYVDVYDLADAITAAVACSLPGHEVFYASAADNAGGNDLADVVARKYGGEVRLRSLARPDASGVSCAKAGHLLGWRPRRSWRDYLDGDGRSLIDAAAGHRPTYPGPVAVSG
jgi:nucleoside-diphosphate-sugar epimerase